MANKKIQLTPELILGQLKTEKTVNDLATKFKKTDATVRIYINTLVDAGQVKSAGTTNTGQRGRPATLYVAA